MANNIKVLLVEDDRVSATLIKKHLEPQGFRVTHCSDGNAGLYSFQKYEYDVCLLDVMMPFKNGFDLAEEIRALDSFIPILFITSNDMDHDKINAFKLGADDYINKPVNHEELVLRIEAILRRQNHKPQKNLNIDYSNIRLGNYTFNYNIRTLSLKGNKRKLTTRESDLLRYLSLNKNEITRKELILKEVWGSDDYFKARSLDVFLSKLRKYLDEDSSLKIINVHGVGFKLVVEQGTPSEAGK